MANDSVDLRDTEWDPDKLGIPEQFRNIPIVVDPDCPPDFWYLTYVGGEAEFRVPPGVRLSFDSPSRLGYPRRLRLWFKRQYRSLHRAPRE